MRVIRFAVGQQWSSGGRSQSCSPYFQVFCTKSQNLAECLPCVTVNRNLFDK